MNPAGALCLVTGASSGIGLATARALRASGAEVVALGRDRAGLEASGGRALVCDLAEEGAAARAAAEAGPVDVLVANAGVGWAGVFAEMEPKAIERLVRVNLTSALELTRALLPGMLERGRGHVVLVGSIVGRVGARDEAAYAATKGGLAAFAESLRQELASAPVGVTLVTPGVIATAFFERRGTPYDRSFPRPLAPERVAAAIVAAIRDDRAEVTVPRWLAVAPRLRGLAPGLYRALASRFG